MHRIRRGPLRRAAGCKTADQTFHMRKDRIKTIKHANELKPGFRSPHYRRANSRDTLFDSNRLGSSPYPICGSNHKECLH